MGALLSVSADAKTVKGQAYGYLTGIMYLAPSKLSGRNLCPDASPGCIAACLNTAGRGVFSTVQQGRIKRSHYFRDDRVGFMAQLVREVAGLVRKSERMGLTPLVRLNGTSDIPWENVPAPACEVCARPFVRLSGDVNGCPVHGIRGCVRNIMACFPAIQFYDYTKSAIRMWRFLDGRMPGNYHLTFSRSECNDQDALGVLSRGGNVAVVFDTKRGAALPTAWQSFTVIDGDVNDARPGDVAGAYNGANGLASVKHHGVVIGLRAKGKARRDSSGFVVTV